MPVLQSVSVSVVMCTYNGALHVKEQLLSITQQTYPLKEVLVFDDTSTDETVSIVREIANRYPVIKLYINKENLGYIRNFEQGLLAAAGDVIAFADQDDVWLPEKIERMVTYWQPELPLIYCYSHATEKIPDAIPVIRRSLRRFEGSDGRKLFVHNTVSGHAMLIRKSFLPLVLPLKAHFFYDWWMALVAAYNGGVQYLPEVLVYQRIHNSNTTHFTEGQMTFTQLHHRFKRNIMNSCEAAATVPDISPEHKRIAEQMAAAMKRSFDSNFYWPLFFLLIKYRKPFFNIKAKKIGLFSHIKYAYRITRN